MSRVRAHERKYHSPALKPGAPFYPETTALLASKRSRSRPQLETVEPVGSAYASVWKTLAKAIGLEARV